MVCRPAGPRANKGGHSTGALRPRQRVCRPSRPENHFMKGLSLAVLSPEGWQTLCRWCEPPVPGVLSGSGDPSFIEFGVFHALSSRHEVTVDCMEATIGTLDNRWIVK